MINITIRPLLFCLWLVCWAGSAPILADSAPASSERSELRPFLLGGIQTHELDHQRWMATLHQAGMNAVQVTVYAHQGPWNTSKLWYHEEEPAVLEEIRTARQNGLQVVLILRVALDHNDPENRFLWHGLIYPETEAATDEWFRIYTDFVVKWGRVAEEEGVEVLGIASEMNSLAATLPVDEIPGLPEYYLDDESQERLRNLVGRSEHLFTEEARRSMGAGDFEVLDEFLVQRNQAERAWASTYTFAEAGATIEDRLAAMNRRRQLLDTRWRELAERAREVYSGRLTLAANFDNYHEVAFWDTLGFMGINAYFPLRATLDTPLSEDGLTAAWHGIFADIDTFRGEHGLALPVVFTELGYTRRQGVTVAPWSSEGFIPLWDPEGDTDNDRAFFWSSQPFDPEERAAAMRALHHLWAEGQIDLAGILYWKLSSQIRLQRFEPFMLHLGTHPGDPLRDAFVRFDDGIRLLSPRLEGHDFYRRAVDAVVRNDLDALVDLGSGASASAPSGWPPLLHLAVRLGRSDAVHHLLHAGAEPDSRDAAGFLPLHWACYQDDPDLVDALIPPGDRPWLDARGETPLMKCARLDNTAVARQLLRHGDQAPARNEQGKTALHLAADQASSAMIEMLLAHGGDAHAGDDEGNTPLHVAAGRGEPEIVEALAKSSKGHPDDNDNLPVHVAAYYGEAEAFHLLFEPEKARATNTKDQSLLHLAAYGGNLDILRTLIPHFPVVDPVDEDGWTPLFCAINDGRVEAVGLLLAHGASVLHRTEEGTTPLHHGAASWEPQVMPQLLQRQEVELDLIDGEENTPLHHAAGWGRLENIRLLLQEGAAPALRNRTGDTAYEIAQESGRRRAALLLTADP